MLRVRNVTAAIVALVAHAGFGGTASAQRVQMIGDPVPLAYSRPVLSIQTPAADDATLGRSAQVPGRLVVRVEESVDICLDCAAAGTAAGSSELDDLNRRFGLRSVRPLRRAHASLPSLKARRQRDARVRGLHRPAGATRPELFRRKQEALGRTYVLELSPFLDMESVARQYERLDTVEYAEPDVEVRIAALTNDPYLASSGAWNQPFEDLWGIHRVSAPAAWDLTAGAGVVIAVIDTGVDFGHADLAERAWVNVGEIPGNDIDDDGNGYVDDVTGFDFANNDSDPFDDHGHGTHVAGTTSARGDNGEGVVGVAHESRVMAIKGLSSGGSGTSSTVADAVLYAAESGAHVINASWGCLCTSQTLSDAIEAAHAAGVVFVAAAGNSHRDVLYDVGFSPANHLRAITVAASDHNDERAFFSNFGAKLDVAAPGGGGDDAGPAFESWRSILSLRSSGAGSDMTGNGKLVEGQRYLRQAGTSMAAPHVAGAAALVLAAHPEYSPEAVRQALRAGADDVGPPGVDPDSGFGRLNAAAAVAAEVLDVDIIDPRPGTVETMNDITVVGRASGVGFASYRVEVGFGEYPTEWDILAGPITQPVVDDVLANWPVGTYADGPYVLRAVARNTAGLEFENRIPVTLDRLTLSHPEEFQMFRPNGPIELRGTASGPDFASYRLEWRSMPPDLEPGPWLSDGISLVGDGSAMVENDTLGWFDPSVLTGNSDVDFRVVVTRVSAQEDAEELPRVVIDPTLRAGWPQRIGAFSPESIPSYDDRFTRHLTVADLDGDGTKEILIAYGDLVHAFRHDGTELSGWPQQLTYPDGTASFVRQSPAVGDLDGDGLPEVVVAEGDTYAKPPVELTHVFRADGTELPGWPQSIIACWYNGTCDPDEDGSPPRGIAIADVDGNGQNDLILVVGPTLQVRDAQGQLLPGWPQMWPEGFQCFSGKECLDSVVAVGDMDGDGSVEIATVGRQPWGSQRPQLLLYDSQGVMKPRFPKSIPGLKYFRRSGWTIATVSNGVHNQPVMADIDGDGDLEIIIQTTRKKLHALHHDGRRAKLRPRRLPDASKKCGRTKMLPWIEPPVVGDLDGDGAAEVVVGVRRGIWKHTRTRWIICLGFRFGPDYLQVLKGTRDAPSAGLPGWPHVLEYRNGDTTAAVASPVIADVDGDLVPEVVFGSGVCVRHDADRGILGNRCFPVSAIDREGNMLPGFPKSTLGPTSNQSISPAVADLNGDGLKEIVWLDFWGNLVVWDVSGTPAPERAPWPMYRGNPALTGALPAR